MNNAELLAKMQEAETTLKQAQRDTKNAHAAQDYFVANVSHDLRTPLATITLWTQLLRTKGNPDAALLKEGLEAIDLSVKEQQALIDDLIDTSRIVAGTLRLEFSETNLNQLVSDALATVTPFATAKGLSLKTVLDPEVGVVRADPRRLRQVLMIILNNAIKFTAAGGRISVKSQRNGNTVEIDVADTGRGISQELLAQVFDRHLPAGQNEGPASGRQSLAIARQLVESHRGTIRAQSDGPGRGAVFSIGIHLPRIATAPGPFI